MPRLAVALLCLASLAAAKPLQVTEGNLPLRVVVRYNGVRMANCVFSTLLIPPHAQYATRLNDSFSDGDHMFARCYFPDHPGSNKPGELSDVFTLDGKKWWTQIYDLPVPSDALERGIALEEVLRSVRPSIPRGDHRIEVVGTLTRGKKTVRLYRGQFRYVR